VHASDDPPVIALRVTTAAEAAARDQAAIAVGTGAFALMLHAGTAAAAAILRDYAGRLSRGVALFAGSGNNGGDTYIVAAQLARAGVAVCGATVHGRAAERATAPLSGVRGGTLEALFDALPSAWRGLEHAVVHPPGVLADLPSPA
jgi:NAD(P)H-hydrate repair Nnr-like enzyme with NAD(P)H-hydrate epimerase domain